MAAPLARQRFGEPGLGCAGIARRAVPPAPSGPCRNRWHMDGTISGDDRTRHEHSDTGVPAASSTGSVACESNAPDARPRDRRIAAGIAAVGCHGERPSGRPASGVVRGRVVIGIPVTVPAPVVGIPARAVSQPRLRRRRKLGTWLCYLKDAPAQPSAPTARRDPAARRDVHAARGRRAGGLDGGISERRSDLPQRVLALARPDVQPRALSARQVTRVRFDKPGIVKVFCDIHSHMTATVMVFNHPWFTVARRGRASSSSPGSLPAGSQITAWHERLGETTMRLRVEGGGVTARSEFVLPVPAQ